MCVCVCVLQDVVGLGASLSCYCLSIYALGLDVEAYCMSNSLHVGLDLIRTLNTSVILVL